MNASNRKRSAQRLRLRKARRQLEPEPRREAEARIASSICKSAWFRQADRIAMYLAFDGEVSLHAAIRAAKKMGKTVYVPRLDSKMCFAPLTPKLTTNAFGIREPHTDSEIPAPRLDLVLVPVVGFDAMGARLGMGGGHYDRYFRRRLHRRSWRRPKLLGVAFEIQRIDQLDREPWDVPLDAIVTERGLAPTRYESKS